MLAHEVDEPELRPAVDPEVIGHAVQLIERLLFRRYRVIDDTASTIYRPTISVWWYPPRAGNSRAKSAGAIPPRGANRKPISGARAESNRGFASTLRKTSSN